MFISLSHAKLQDENADGNQKWGKPRAPRRAAAARREPQKIDGKYSVE
jgi:hypothetical protein